MTNYNYDRYLPTVTSPFSLVEDPLSAIARRSPTEAAWAIHRALGVRKIEARTSLMRSVSSDHAAMACTWLQNRQSGEKNMAIGTDSHSSEGSVLFPQGERVRMVTKISIW